MNELKNNPRIQSVDILRGLVMVLMAVDHVRVYSGVPPGGPEAGVFFTRWITHFCAPAFAFFAGTSAFLYGIKLNDRTKLAKYLLTRGLILVILEMTLLRFLWAFNINYSEFTLMGVIWMLGVCMMLLAGLIWIQPKALGFIGIAVILYQKLFSHVPSLLPESLREGFGKIWEFIYPAGYSTFNGVAILYVIIPWIGVMAAGYGFGLILTLDEQRRNKYCWYIGSALTITFLVAASIQVLTSEQTEGSLPFLLQLLNQRKYPASAMYLMMTLGPVILLIPYFEKIKNGFTNILSTIGRVPLFYYILHILVIHVSALVVQLVHDGAIHHEWFTHAPYSAVPEENRWSLPLLYAVFLIDIIILYFLCKWYDRYKSSHREIRWLAYL